MSKKLILVSIFIAVTSIGYAGDNYCRIDSLKIVNANCYSVDLVMSNSDTIAGFQIPLIFKVGEDTVEIDSITFPDSRCTTFQTLGSKSDSANHIAYIFGYFGGEYYEPLAPGNGAIARIYLKINMLQSNAVLSAWPVDFTVGSNKLRYSVWKSGMSTVLCRFAANPISILQ